MQTIIISNLKIDAIIGVWDWEQKLQQPLYVDMQLYKDFSVAMHTDELTETLDYQAVCERVTHCIQAQPTALLERLLGKVSQTLFAEFAITKLEITIKKPTAIDATDYVAACLHQTVAEHHTWLTTAVNNKT